MKALEMLPIFIIGIELKDIEGEKYETEPQNCRSVARLLERGAIFFGGIIKLLPQDCSQLEVFHTLQMFLKVIGLKKGIVATAV